MATPYDPQFSQFAQQLRQEVQGVLNHHAGFVRKYTEEQLKVFDARLNELSKIAQALAATRDGQGWERRADRGIVRVEDIPGRRVPYDLLVDINIGNNSTSQQASSVTISQEGPFVAVKRVATFMSSLQFQVTSGGSTAIFSGRSFGRYRPIHSAWDIFDAASQGGYDASAVFLQSLIGGQGAGGGILPTPLLPAAAPNPVITGAPPIVSAASGFRSMEFDGRIFVLNAGSSYPRQNTSVPSSLWTSQINSPQELGALDFFERGEVMTLQVQPNHVNNPPAGNANGATLFNLAAGSYPFENGQYDPQEGIATGSGLTMTVSPVAAVGPPSTYQKGTAAGITTDSIQRLPDGILTLGWIGYRIIQPVGPA